jgi:DnaJ-class molecular chaperone
MDKKCPKCNGMKIIIVWCGYMGSGKTCDKCKGKGVVEDNNYDYGVNNPVNFQSEDSSKRFFKPK